MKGVVFTEFLDLVDERFGIDVVDRIITACDLETGGAYTKVGTYDHHELLQLVDQLSRESQIPAPTLVRTFGEFLFGRFLVGYPTFFTDVDSTFGLLAGIDEAVHAEVRKLYPDAELPEFETQQTESRLELIYRSTRPFADLAEGLIRACIAHYHERIEFERIELNSADGSATRFVLTATGPPSTSA